MKEDRLIEFIKLLLSVLVCQLAGFVGSIFTIVSISTWYMTLNKPFFTPPNWLFAPVWIILFALMGISLFLVWRKGLNIIGVKTAVIVFFLQLTLNVLWSIAFFGLRSPLAGLIVIAILWFAIIWTILRFYKISSISALLLIPYILWVSFAAVLNLSILILNYKL